MKQLEQYLKRIQTQYPQFSRSSAKYLGRGQYNNVITLDDTWIFRFPRHAIGGESLHREARTLQALRGNLPLAIPYPEFVHIEDDAAQSFMGYRMIDGTPLTREAAAALDEGQLRNLADQVVEFLLTLHKTPIPAHLTVPDNIIGPWENLYQRIERLLFPHMRPDAREWARAHFSSFLEDSANHNLQLCLIHGDCGAANFVSDPEHRSIVGVIDFGSVAVGDPATDFAAAATIHPQLLGLMIEKHTAVKQCLRRIAFYKGTYALQEALYGVEADDEGAFHAGIQEYV